MRISSVSQSRSGAPTSRQSIAQAGNSCNKVPPASVAAVSSAACKACKAGKQHWSAVNAPDRGSAPLRHSCRVHPCGLSPYLWWCCIRQAAYEAGVGVDGALRWRCVRLTPGGRTEGVAFLEYRLHGHQRQAHWGTRVQQAASGVSTAKCTRHGKAAGCSKDWVQ